MNKRPTPTKPTPVHDRYRITPATGEGRTLNMLWVGGPKSGKSLSSLLTLAHYVGMDLPYLVAHPDEFLRVRETSPIVVVDTEHNASALYARYVPFRVMHIENYHPATILGAIQATERDPHAKAIQIDSLSPFWSGQGGVLDLVDQATPGNASSSPQAWKEIKPVEVAFMELLVKSPLAVSGVVQAQQTIKVLRGDDGKTVIEKLPDKVDQREKLMFATDIVMRATGEPATFRIEGRLPDLPSIFSEQLAMLHGTEVHKAGRDFGMVLRNLYQYTDVYGRGDS